MSSSDPLVSIITPVYNAAAYLEECIESVLAQSYQNWDYTIVDNCSTDASGEIAARYAGRDPRVRVHRNHDFLHAVANHNVAFRQISPASKYCKMIFADDWMFPECLARMVEFAEKYPSVGIVHCYSLDGRKVLWSGLPYSREPVSGRYVCRELFLNSLYIFGSATSMLYRSDLVRSRDPFYNEANLHADTETTIDLLRACDFGFVHQVLTFTRERPGSLTALSCDMDTYRGGSLQALVSYGPDYLAADELRACLDGQLSAYYGFLAKAVLLGRWDCEFWDYHKQKLAEAGTPYRSLRVGRAVARELGKALLNPEKVLKRLRARSRTGKD